MQTLKEHLASLGMLGKEVDNAVLDKVKKQYYKEYHRQYYKQYKDRRIRVETRFSKSEYALLKQSARRHHKRASTHLKESALAYMEQSYVVPDERLLQDLKLQIRAIGNNVNQIAYRANSSRGKAVDIQALFSQLNRLEKLIEEKLTSPLLMKEAIREAVQYSRITQSDLRELLESVTKDE